LKRLETKCTIAVAAIATGRGKKRAKTGIKRVDNPKPEYSTIAEITKLARAITTRLLFNMSFTTLIYP